MGKKDQAEQEHTEYCAQQILNKLAAIDPVWKDFIRMAREENNWTAFQAVGNWVAYVMDNQLHMVVTQNPIFQPGGTVTLGEYTCPVCNVRKKAIFPGQQQCASHFGAPMRLADPAEFDPVEPE